MSRFVFLSVSFPDFTLPLSDPVLVFALVLFIILLAPMLLSRFRIPGIIGLIVAGVFIGPHGFNLLERNEAIVLFGTVGLLYIMFLAGLELELTQFWKNKYKNFSVGILSFLVPFLLGIPVCYYYLEFSLKSSLLIATTIAPNTLVAYTITSRLGISRNEAVAVSVGATIIADTLVLVILSVFTGSTDGSLDAAFWLRLIISLALFLAAVFLLMTPIARWFFKYMEGEKSSQYIFVLAMVFLAAFLAKLAGMEPIIGAFMAGLALNRLIPHTSPLMNRIEFAGNALFIPFFLISVGMLVDLRIFLHDLHALNIAVALTAVAIFGKWASAYISQWIFHYTNLQRELIFGLTTARAAATLAVILVGFKLGLLDESVLNASVLLILVTCTVSSFVTENTGRKIALLERDKKQELEDEDEKILVPISNPATIETMMDLAIMMKDPHSRQPISALAVVKEDNEAREKVVASNKMLERAIIHAAAVDAKVKILTRVDLNVASGISRAIKELSINTVIIGSSARTGTTGVIFGTMLENLLNYTRQMLMVCNITMPLNLIKRILVVAPDNAEFEKGFHRWAVKALNFSKQAGASVKIYSSPKTLEAVLAVADEMSLSAQHETFTDMQDFRKLSMETRPDDLIVFVSARKGTLSYEKSLDEITGSLTKHFSKNSFIIIYPEQIFANSENVYTVQDPHFIL